MITNKNTFKSSGLKKTLEKNEDSIDIQEKNEDKVKPNPKIPQGPSINQKDIEITRTEIEELKKPPPEISKPEIKTVDEKKPSKMEKIKMKNKILMKKNNDIQDINTQPKIIEASALSDDKYADKSKVKQTVIMKNKNSKSSIFKNIKNKDNILNNPIGGMANVLKKRVEENIEKWKHLPIRERVIKFKFLSEALGKNLDEKAISKLITSKAFDSYYLKYINEYKRHLIIDGYYLDAVLKSSNKVIYKWGNLALNHIPQLKDYGMELKDEGAGQDFSPALSECVKLIVEDSDENLPTLLPKHPLMKLATVLGTQLTLSLEKKRGQINHQENSQNMDGSQNKE